MITTDHSIFFKSFDIGESPASKRVIEYYDKYTQTRDHEHLIGCVEKISSIVEDPQYAENVCHAIHNLAMEILSDEKLSPYQHFYIAHSVCSTIDKAGLSEQLLTIQEKWKTVMKEINCKEVEKGIDIPNARRSGLTVYSRHSLIPDDLM